MMPVINGVFFVYARVAGRLAGRGDPAGADGTGAAAPGLTGARANACLTSSSHPAAASS